MLVLAMCVSSVETGAYAEETAVTDKVNKENGWDGVTTVNDADFRHHNAGISGMESGISGNKAKHEKCIFNATRKFSTTESNRRRCTHMFKIHNSIS